MSNWDYDKLAYGLQAIAAAIEKLAEAHVQAAKIRVTENPNLTSKR